MTENGKIKKAKDTTQEYFFLKTLLYTALFDGLVLYIIGFEGIYNHAGWFIGVSVFVLALLGLYAKSIEELKEERKIPEDEELFGMKSFTLLLIALSMIGMVFYIKNDEQYNKQVGYKIFEVFNYSNNDKTVTIDNKTYTLHPKTHKRITLQKEK
ncbi:MAG: hypothetical protein GXO11_03370, partial [Epsilonproteobacteria bacterium]|nr:hypothetical protein [Campylobacterota bacterium]